MCIRDRVATALHLAGVGALARVRARMRSEVAAPAAGRRAMEARGLAHMWDAVANVEKP